MDWTEKDVKTWKRKDNGGLFSVVVPGTTGWTSSGQSTKKKAIDWALIQANGGIQPTVTFGEYSKDFFIPGLCPIIRIRERAHGKRTLKHWDTLRQLHEDYILPKWGRNMIPMIEAARVFDWLDGDLPTIKEFAAVKDGPKSTRQMSTARRNTILIAMREAFDQAVIDRLIPGNSLNSIPKFSEDDDLEEGEESTAREIFQDDESLAMFPADLEKLDRLWGGRRWAALYMILDDTGHRPSEVLALRSRDWHPNERAFVVSRKIDSRGNVGPLKAPKKKQGVKRKVGLVGVRTADLVEGLILEHQLGDDDLLFPAPRMKKRRGMPMRVAVAGNHFCDSLDKDGSPVHRRGRTLYCLKHTALTGFRTDLGLDEAALMVGHTTRKTGNIYDHPDDAVMVARAIKVAGRG